MMRTIAVNDECLASIKPAELSTSWYDAAVDVVGKHISGLLLVKEMPNDSKRIVFTNEAGVKFFDFEFKSDRSFVVHHIMEQLNKRAVVNLLRDDFYLMLGLPFDQPVWESWEMNDEKYFGVSEAQTNYYLVTTGDCKELVRLESGSERKKKLMIKISGNDSSRPDSIALRHQTFNMTINLKKLSRDNAN